MTWKVLAIPLAGVLLWGYGGSLDANAARWSQPVVSQPVSPGLSLPSFDWRQSALIVRASGDDENNRKRKQLEDRKAAAKQREAVLSAQLEGIRSDLAQLAMQLQHTKDAIPAAQGGLVAAKQKLQESKHKLEVIRSRLRLAQVQKKHLQEEIERGKKTIAATQIAIGQIAQQAYRGQKLDISVWTLLLDSKSPDELVIRAQVASRAAQAKNHVIESAEEASAAAANAKARQETVTIRIGELETQAKAALAAADLAQQEEHKHLVTLQNLEESQTKQQNLLNTKKADFEQQIKEQQAVQAEMAKQIAIMVAESRRGPNRVVTGGIFGAPLSVLNRTSPFGWRVHPILKIRILHTGTDLGMPCGSPVYASQSGTARLLRNGVSGNYIFVNHGSINGVAWQTGYAHLSAYKVSDGQHVEKGQVIGLVGSTGRSTGCHLHFEVWKNGSPIDSYQALLGH